MKYLIAVVVGATSMGACAEDPDSGLELAPETAPDEDPADEVRSAELAEQLAVAGDALAWGALRLSLDVHARLDRRYGWEMTLADPPAAELALGESRRVAFPLEIHNVAVADDGFHVDGALVITNDGHRPASVATLIALAGDVRATVTCPVALPTSIAPGGALTCRYQASLPDRRDREVVAAALGSGAATAHHRLRFDDPGTRIYIWDALVEATAAGVGHVYLTDGRTEPSVRTEVQREIGPFTACGPFAVPARASLRALDGLGSTRSDRLHLDVTATAHGEVICP